MITVRRGVANSLLDGGEFFFDDRLDAGARAQDVEIVGDFHGELVELGLDLVAAKRGQALQAKIENGLGLLGGKFCRAGGRHAVARIVDQRDHGGDVLRRPVALHQLLARLVGVLGGTDQFDHLVDIGDRDGETDQYVGTIARLAEQMLGAPVDHLLAERQEQRQEILQVHHQRPAVVERDHVGAERRLQCGEAIKLVEHYVRNGVAPHFDHDAETVAVGFIAQRRNAFESSCRAPVRRCARRGAPCSPDREFRK